MKARGKRPLAVRGPWPTIEETARLYKLERKKLSEIMRLFGKKETTSIKTHLGLHGCGQMVLYFKITFNDGSRTEGFVYAKQGIAETGRTCPKCDKRFTVRSICSVD